MTAPDSNVPSASAAAPRAVPTSRSFLWWGAALGTLVLGYADLWRGGETIAPLLLVIGYLVLVPLAILRG